MACALLPRFCADTAGAQQQTADTGPVFPVSAVDDPVLDPSPHTSSESIPDTAPHPPCRSCRNRNSPILYGDPVQLTSGDNIQTHRVSSKSSVLWHKFGPLPTRKLNTWLTFLENQPKMQYGSPCLNSIPVTSARHNITHKPPPVIT